MRPLTSRGHLPKKSTSQNTAQSGRTRVGVISDTHSLLRPEVITALTGVDKILHAGDVGSSEVLESLSKISPVVAVRGNNDKGEWAEMLPDWEVVQIGEISIYMLHNLNEIDLSPAASGFQVVVSGHSHQPSVENLRGVIYLNPGSAGPKRFKLPVALAFLEIVGQQVEVELLELD